jgi:hypothetical protein
MAFKAANSTLVENDPMGDTLSARLFPPVTGLGPRCAAKKIDSGLDHPGRAVACTPAMGAIRHVMRTRQTWRVSYAHCEKKKGCSNFAER